MTENQKNAGLAKPFSDVVFKVIFDREMTMRFLNSILDLESPIVDVEFDNSESNDTSIYGKRVYFDVLCTDANGRHFIVEMQNVWQSFLRNRILFYACRIINDMGRHYEDTVRDLLTQGCSISDADGWNKVHERVGWDYGTLSSSSKIWTSMPSITKMYYL